MDPDEYDQSDLFQASQGLQPYYDKFQWLEDPLWVNLHRQIANLPDTQEWSTRWFSPTELFQITDPSQRKDVAFHDPQEHGTILQAYSRSSSRQLDS